MFNKKAKEEEDLLAKKISEIQLEKFMTMGENAHLKSDQSFYLGLAHETIDMLIESLGNEAEQAMSIESLKDIKSRAEHIRPMQDNKGQYTITESQRNRIDRLLDHIEQLIDDGISLELCDIYSIVPIDYNDFQEAVRKGVKIICGEDCNALDFLRFYDKGISIKSTIESTVAMLRKEERMCPTQIATDLR
jgi:hypothetical protein